MKIEDSFKMRPNFIVLNDTIKTQIDINIIMANIIELNSVDTKTIKKATRNIREKSHAFP